jgi:ABC-2 type transport system permease protein
MTAATRPLYWSIRRELWENRSVILAPLIVAAVVLFGSLITMIDLPKKVRALPPDDPARQHVVFVSPFSLAPAPIMLTTLLVGVFYSIDALYGERRDRSMLFWKSLPVSDKTTVLSKAAVPLVVLPLIGFVLSIVVLAVMSLWGTAVLLVNGISPMRLWNELRLVQQPIVMIYGLTVFSLWFAPIYAWLLLVSAWARRLPLLWALFPLLVLGLVGRLLLSGAQLAHLVQGRVAGPMSTAFRSTPRSGGILDRLAQLDPLRFLSTPGLWLGLLFAAACLIAAIRLRRSREPI